MDQRNARGLKIEPSPDPDTKLSRLDPRFTDAVINQTGNDAHPRLDDIWVGLILHLHAFIREENVTLPELYAGIDFVQKAAKNSELGLLLGPTGAEAVSEEITFQHEDADVNAGLPTTQTGSGPFYRPFAPLYNNGDSIVSGFEKADHVLIHGRVSDCVTDRPLPNAEVDIWQAGANGLYDHEDPEQPEWNLRGRFISAEDGSYSLISLRPTCYPIPTQGATGELLRLLDRHPFRPGHIHFKVTARGYLPLVTAIYEEKDRYLESDAVFEVRDSVVAKFEKRTGDSRAEFEVKWDFRLVSDNMASEEARKAAAVNAGLS